MKCKRIGLKDSEVLDGWWDLYPLGRHDRVTKPVDWLDPTTCKLTGSVTVGGTFWLLLPCMRKLHTRPALTWTAVSTFIRSHQQT